MTLNSSVRWGRVPGLLETRVAGRLTSLPPSAELPLVLDPSAAAVMDVLDGATLEEVVGRITAAYDVPDEVARQDITRLIEVLARHGVVVPVGAGNGA